MPSLKELDDERIYHDGLEIARLREELVNANKTIEHLTAAHKVLVEKIAEVTRDRDQWRRVVRRTS